VVDTRRVDGKVFQIVGPETADSRHTGGRHTDRQCNFRSRP